MKVFTLTGAATELGRVLAEHVITQGHAVVLTDPDRIGGRSVLARLQDLHQGAGPLPAVFVPTMLEHEDDAQRLVSTALSHFGRLDAAVNIAWAVPSPGRLHELDEDFFERTLGITLHELHLTLRAQLRHFRSVGGGAICNTISYEAADTIGSAGLVDVTVAAVSALTSHAAVEYATENVRMRPFLSVEPDRRPSRDLGTYRALAARRVLALVEEDIAAVGNHLPRVP